MSDQLGSVTIRDARIIFRNFEGKEGPYNKAGTRNFGVVLQPGDAEAMANDGWNIKLLEPREEDKEEGTEATPWLPVEAAYDKGRPPTVVLITDHGRKNLDEETIKQLDWVDITKINMIVNPYTWTVNGKSGVKAYLKTMDKIVEFDKIINTLREEVSQ